MLGSAREGTGAPARPAWRRAPRTTALLLAAALVGTATAPPALATSIDDFHVLLSVGGGGATSEPIDVPVTVDEKGIGRVQNFTESSAGEWEISISQIVLDPDPEINYAMSIIDFGTPSTFDLLFTQVIVPTPAPGLVFHTHSSSTISGGGGSDSVPVTAMTPPGGMLDSDSIAEIAVYNLSTDGGGSFLSAQLDLSPSFVGAGPSDDQGPFSEGFIPGPAGSGSYDFMRVEMSFGMEGGFDTYTFNGQAVVIPEPGAGALLALGLGLLGAGRQRGSAAA